MKKNPTTLINFKMIMPKSLRNIINASAEAKGTTVTAFVRDCVVSELKRKGHKLTQEDMMFPVVGWKKGRKRPKRTPHAIRGPQAKNGGVA